MVAFEYRTTDILFRTVRLNGTCDSAGKCQHGILLRITSGFVYTHYIFVRAFRFLQSLDDNIVIAGRNKRECLAQRTGMFPCGESLDTLVQHFGFLGHLRLIQSTCMGNQTICKGMIAQILTILIRVMIACFRSMKQCQAKGIAVGVVPAIFAVVHNRDAILAIVVSQVRPILRIHFISGQHVIASLNTADAKVISRFLIINIQGKFGFQKGIGRLPVDFIIEVYAIGQFAFVEADILAEQGFAMTFFNA